MTNSITDRTFALAGVFQAATLVAQIAIKKPTVEDAFVASIHSIFKLNSDDVLSIYSGQENLQLGLTKLPVCLSKQNKLMQDKLIAQYAIALLTLERKLNKQEAMRDLLRQRIVRADEQAKHFGSITHASVIGSLADAYLKTLSTLKYRIQVKGDPQILQQPYVIDKIRALLLAGVRASVLWRQLGGTMWQLLFSRQQYVQAASLLLAQYPTPSLSVE